MATVNGSGNSPTTPSDEGSNSSANMTRIVRQEMGDTWRHDANFFKKFFPVNVAVDPEIQDIQARLYNLRRGRWKGIGAKIKSLASLSTKLLYILNGMLDDELKKKRMHYKTAKPRKVYSTRKTSTTPSLFLAGTGPEFANIAFGLPFAQYAQGIAPFEVRLDSSNKTQGHGRLAAHAHELFIDQENRRFLFGVVLTQHTMTMCMFDRSGALFSDPLDYHANPAQFCAVILGLAKNDAVSVGFDTTIYAEELSGKLRTRQSDDVRRTRSEVKLHEGGTVYTLKARVFRPRIVVGKGTVCWRAINDRTREECVIKDTWIAPDELPGRESEAALLWHVQRKGLTRGVAQIRHCEAVLLPTSNIPDTVMRNRKLRGAPDPAVERVHNRLVLETYGKTLDDFSSRRELLLAYHDAVLAHRNLFEKAGILHRDVSVRNILINPDGEEGDRGILIDLDSAIRVDDTSPYSALRHIGTWPYKSRNVLDGGEHTYFDDLESFYYVLCYITVGYARPLTPVVPHPEILDAWEGRFAKRVKQGGMFDSFDLHVNDWFGEPFQTLCAGLHSFFEIRTWKAMEDRQAGRHPTVNPSDDYEEFISHIRTAISSSGMDGDDNCEHESRAHDGNGTQGGPRPRRDLEPDDEFKITKPRKRNKAPLRRLPPIARPRRAIANYRYFPACFDFP